MPEDNFYKDKYFDTLDTRLDALQSSIEELRKEIEKISSKVTWIYAWAAGVGTVAAFVINLIIKK